ncbi:uracil-DNA glycosylase [Halomonas sp. I1]|uniref:uracil-DNA glycosylase n=1 Tax=Halomonas sp. I1 TaxID=393536 RepID=UPI0028DF074B|nr:uracil-DNA glycosylase [Halomonas sp. I1]MDT8896058.1 uracil-DNA glycosylase [Halomonas sp. I1]
MKTLVTPKSFVEKVSSINRENVFNPYWNVCQKYDKPDASKGRREILYKLVDAASKMSIDSLWIGRDLGYRGGRRTGLALTDEIRASSIGERWGVKIPRFTYGEPVSEMTATVIWSMLSRIDENIFLWNVFPLHPFSKGNSFSNRSHNAEERKIGEEVLSDLVELINPKRIVAIGNDAEASAKRICRGLEVVKFRHPSYGGKNVFIQQAQQLYGVKPQVVQTSLF